MMQKLNRFSYNVSKSFAIILHKYDFFFLQKPQKLPKKVKQRKLRRKKLQKLLRKLQKVRPRKRKLTKPEVKSKKRFWKNYLTKNPQKKQLILKNSRKLQNVRQSAEENFFFFDQILNLSKQNNLTRLLGLNTILKCKFQLRYFFFKKVEDTPFFSNIFDFNYFLHRFVHDLRTLA